MTSREIIIPESETHYDMTDLLTDFKIENQEESISDIFNINQNILDSDNSIFEVFSSNNSQGEVQDSISNQIDNTTPIPLLNSRDKVIQLSNKLNSVSNPNSIYSSIILAIIIGLGPSLYFVLYLIKKIYKISIELLTIAGLILTILYVMLILICFLVFNNSLSYINEEDKTEIENLLLDLLI